MPSAVSDVPKSKVGEVVQQFVNAGVGQVSVTKDPPPKPTYTVTPQS